MNYYILGSDMFRVTEDDREWHLLGTLTLSLLLCAELSCVVQGKGRKRSEGAEL